MLTLKTGFYHFRVLEAENGAEALNKIQCAPVDIVIVDYMLPETTGAELAEEILQAHSSIRIIVMSESPDLLHIVKTRNSGASGFILKTIQTHELLSAVGEILKGKHYYSTVVANKLLQPYSTEIKETLSSSRKVTPREHVVLRLIVLGKTNKEIASELFIGERTVETHRKNLMYKLQVRNVAALIRVSYEQELLP
jgi:DNA-binding NarL/FixJ family response regulator